MSMPDDMPLGDREAAELAALADGSLPPERRAALERRIAESSQLRVALEEQVRARQAVRAAEVGAPPQLRAALLAKRDRDPGSRLIPTPVAVGLGAAATTVALVGVLALPGSGPNRPTVAAAAGLALRAPSAPVPEHSATSATTLPVRLDGINYPNWYPHYGWVAAGVRSDRLNGRRATTVFYDKKGRRIGYTVVSGERLAAPRSATTTVRHGVTLRSFSLSGRPVVTWERMGHTCVLAGATDSRVLMYLATWKPK